MSEKDEQLCEVCGRERGVLRGQCNAYDDPDGSDCLRLGYEREKARADTLRLDVAWWRARVEAAESKCQERHMQYEREKARAEAAEAAQARLRMAIGFLLSCIASGEELSEGEEAELRALTSAASAPQAPPACPNCAKLTEALRAIVERLDGDRHFINPDGGAEMLLAARRALTSAASAPQAPPSDAAEEVK